MWRFACPPVDHFEARTDLLNLMQLLQQQVPWTGGHLIVMTCVMMAPGGAVQAGLCVLQLRCRGWAGCVGLQRLLQPLLDCQGLQRQSAQPHSTAPQPAQAFASCMRKLELVILLVCHTSDLAGSRS